MIENYCYRRCPDPGREFRSVVSLHNHSSHSTENLASLNQVIELWFMRPFAGLLQRSFGLGWVEHLDYAEVRYNPPFSPEQVFDLELGSVRRLGFDRLSVAITDHDEISGSLELLARRPAARDHMGLGEELSVRFQGHLFHLGVTGLEPETAAATHAALQAASRAGRLDDLFEQLRARRCLVVLNHPLLPWDGDSAREIPAVELLNRFGWAIDALEYNGMRRREENDGVLALARQTSKPVVGGGDSHLLAASCVLSASSDAETYSDFVEEVKSGRAVPLIKRDYFWPLRWKLFLRVLCFIAHYRKIGYYRQEPAASAIRQRLVLLDPVGYAARAFLGAASALRLIR